MQEFDVVLKVLLRSSMSRITGSRIVRWLPTELPKVQNLSVDLLGETEDGELMQIEVQSSNRKDVPFRMLQYLAFIVAIHRRIPKQVLLYVGRESLRMESEFSWADGFVRYATIDMRSVAGEPLLASPEPSDNVLAILARLTDTRAAVHNILEKISRLPADETKEYYRALLILAGLRGLAKTVQQEAQTVIEIDILENEVLGPAYLRAVEEGKHSGQISLLRQLIEQRFGEVPAWVDEKLSESSAGETQAIGLRVLDARSLEDLFR